MGVFVNRQNNEDINPTLAGGVYGKYITLGRPVYFNYDGTQTRFILFIADGGKYGLDSIDTIEYKSNALVSTDWVFHRGTITKQITPKAVTINSGTNVFTSTAHGFVNTNTVRLRSIDGLLPQPLNKTVKYYIIDKTDDTFKLSLTSGGAEIDITDVGSGDLIVWRANAGFDDPEQGLPTFCPEVNTTFSNIAYIEGKLPAGVSTFGQEPDWIDFRILGTGRRLMDYDDEGAELGIVEADETALSNVALQLLDNLLVNYRVKESRIDFPSWVSLKGSADVDILQRPILSNTAIGAGKWTGRYYGDTTFTNLIATRLDLFVDFDFGTSAPLAGMPTTNYSIQWNSQIKPLFSENYTFKLRYDDSIKIYIDGQIVYNDPVWDGGVEKTFVISLTANRIYDIQIELVQAVSDARCNVYWQSASQTLQAIPAVSTDLVDTSIVKRYSNWSAFPNPVEASEVHERLIERCVGWDWTDDNGKITFLSPSRAVKFSFNFDMLVDDAQANFASFTKKRRRIKVRKNFSLFKYRNSQVFGYPVRYTQADRPETRRFNNSEPNNDPAEDLGISTRSLAERMAEMNMVLKSDPKYTADISGDKRSGKIRKNDLVKVSYFDTKGRRIENEQYIITLHSWGASNGKNDFQLLPLKENFYNDEQLVIVPEQSPIECEATWNAGTHKATVTWENRNAIGVIYIERKKDSGSYSQVATLPFNETEWIDETITINGSYTYRVRNANIPSEYSTADPITVASEDDEGDFPDNLAVSEVSGDVLCEWDNNGGTGDNVIQRKGTGGSFVEVGRVASGVDEFLDESITVTDTYIYRILNEDEVGYSEEESIFIDRGSEVGSPPSGLWVYDGGYSGYVNASWTNNGASGANIIEMDSGAGYEYLTEVTSLETMASFTLPFTGMRYFFRISNTSCVGYDYTSYYHTGYEF